MQEIRTNTVGLMGVVSTPCQDLRECDDIMLKGNMLHVQTVRTSGTTDDVIVIAPEDKDVQGITEGTPVMVCGSLQTYKNMATGKVLVYVYADSCLEAIGGEHWEPENEVEIYGALGKGTNYRETPNGRRITDLKIAVPCVTREGNSCYIPAVCWGNNALMVSGWEEGTRVHIKGRMQSRKYIKKLNDLPFPMEEERTAYELSIYYVELEEESEANYEHV